jgi:hypothetical protein
VATRVGQAATEQLQAFVGEESIRAIRFNNCVTQPGDSLLLSVDVTVRTYQHRMQFALTARQGEGGTYYECTRVFQDLNPNVRLSDNLQYQMRMELAHMTAPHTTSA